MYIAIHAGKDPGGKRFLSALERRIEREQIRAWEVRRKNPLTLVHSGERYAGVRVTFVPGGTRGFAQAVKDGGLGAFSDPQPALLATITGAASADRVLGFLVGMLTRHAEPLGVTGVGIPLHGPRR